MLIFKKRQYAAKMSRKILMVKKERIIIQG